MDTSITLLIILATTNNAKNIILGTSKYGSSEKSFELTSKLYDLQDEFDEAI